MGDVRSERDDERLVLGMYYEDVMMLMLLICVVFCRIENVLCLLDENLVKKLVKMEVES